MATASPEPESKADEFVLTVRLPENNSDPSNDHTATAMGSDDGSSKDGVPVAIDDKPEDKPVAINIDPSGPKSPSLIALHHLGPHFKDYITLNSLHPYLNKHNLLTSNEDATLMLPTVTDVDKIQQLVSWLPHKGPDFLDRFNECLRDSSATSQGTTAHRELADQLDSVRITAEKKLRESGEDVDTDFPKLKLRNGASTFDDEVVTDHPVSRAPAVMDQNYIPLQEAPTGATWQKYFSAKCVVIYSLFVVITVVLTIVTFVPLASLPRFDENKITPLTIHEGMTVELSFDVSTKQLENGSLGINNNCYGSLYIIGGMQCRDLYDDYTSNDTDDVSELEYHWLLPGSHIEYTLAANASIDMWLFMDEIMPRFSSCNIVRQSECSEFSSICHQVHNQNKTPVIKTIQITEPGNYFLCFSPLNQNIRATVYSRTYNNEKIAGEFVSLEIDATQPPTLYSFGHRFWQYTPSCVLAHIESCFSNEVGQVSGSVSKRKDTIVLGVFVLLLSFIVLFVLVSVHVSILCVQKHASSL